MYKNTSKNIEVIHKPREILETEQNTIQKKMKKKTPVQINKTTYDFFSENLYFSMFLAKNENKNICSS